MLPEQAAPPSEMAPADPPQDGTSPGVGNSADDAGLNAAADAAEAAIARLYGEPLTRLPNDLYIPPDALEVFLDAFEGPLDLLLYLIRRQNFNILDIPMAQVTLQLSLIHI